MNKILFCIPLSLILFACDDQQYGGDQYGVGPNSYLDSTQNTSSSATAQVKTVQFVFNAYHLNGADSSFFAVDSIQGVEFFLNGGALTSKVRLQSPFVADSNHHQDQYVSLSLVDSLTGTVSGSNISQSLNGNIPLGLQIFQIGRVFAYKGSQLETLTVNRSYSDSISATTQSLTLDSVYGVLK